MDKGPSRQKVMQQQKDAGSLQHAPSGFSTKTTNTQVPDDVTATATTFSYSGTSSCLGISTASVTQALDVHNVELQTTLKKHWDDILRLLWTGTGQRTIPEKMLDKTRMVNMTSMTQANYLISHTGKKEFSTCRLKEFGSNAEQEPMKLYEGKMAEQDATDHEPPPTINDSTLIDARNTKRNQVSMLESSVADPQCANEFWKLTFSNRCHILSMKQDGNCFFHCISDQLNHNNRGSSPKKLIFSYGPRIIFEWSYLLY
jgi:hypothetical protein